MKIVPNGRKKNSSSKSCRLLDKTHQEVVESTIFKKPMTPPP